MVMSVREATDVAQKLRKTQQADREQLDILRRYWKGTQPLPAVIPSDSPAEVREMARVARVNVIKIVIESITQSLFVTSLRVPDDADDKVVDRAWKIWQANGMDARQSGLVRATTAYGTGYEVVLPGDPAPVMRPVSPRRMTAMYGADDLWPDFALEWSPRTGMYWLFDREAVYPFTLGRDSDQMNMVVDGVKEHGAGVTPVVRFRDADDLDEDDEPESGLGSGLRLAPRSTITSGQVSPLVELQDQMNLTSFSLKAAEWYSAFRQRWAIGYKPGSTTEKMQAAASQFWTFDEDPDRMRVGEFGQTELRGYLDSRMDSAKFAATLSQTPVHELIGELVNLSAEALAAAEIGRDRMVDERKIGQGEAHEQALRLACSYENLELPDDAEVIYKDTSARAFGAVVDGLGKIAQMLQVPPQELWSRIPGATKQDVDRWKQAFEEGDSITQLNDLLAQQAGGGAPADPGRSPGGIILPRGARA
jgi:hypothetical protein